MRNVAGRLGTRVVNHLGLQAGDRYRTVAEERIVEHLTLHGWAHEWRAGLHSESVAAAREALERWIGHGLAYAPGRDGAGRAFDPAEVVNFCKTAALDANDPIWRERFVATGRKLVEEHGRHAGLRFSLVLARTFDLSRHAPGAQLRLRLPLPLAEARLRVSAPAEVTRQERRAGRLELRATVPSSRSTLTVSVELEFASPATPNDDDETALYLRPEEGLVRVTPRVASLARKLAAGKTAFDAVRAFWQFLFEMRLGVLHYDELSGGVPIESLLEHRWFDCHLGSALFVALCRAREIPARLCAGYLLYPAAPTYHYWAEAFVEGRWSGFDLGSWDLSAGGADPAWRSYFFDYLNPRMQTERFPRSFTGTGSLRFPPAWHLLVRPVTGGAAFGFYSVDSGDLLYEDCLTSIKASPL